MNILSIVLAHRPPTHLVFSLLNCTVYVLEEALFPLRLPLCSCSCTLLQSDIVTTVVVFVVVVVVVVAAVPRAAGAPGDVGGVPAATAAANVVSVTLLGGDVTDKGI